MSILLYVFIDMKTHGGESHTKRALCSYTTIWQDIVFSIVIFNNKCTNFPRFLLPSSLSYSNVLYLDMTLSKYLTSVKDTAHEHKNPHNWTRNKYHDNHMSMSHAHIHGGNTAHMTVTWLHLQTGRRDHVLMCASRKHPHMALDCVGQCKS